MVLGYVFNITIYNVVLGFINHKQNIIDVN